VLVVQLLRPRLSRRRPRAPAEYLNTPEPNKPEPSRMNVPGSGTVLLLIDIEIESLDPEQLGLSATSLQILEFRNWPFDKATEMEMGLLLSVN
jgi:hypothetical protein